MNIVSRAGVNEFFAQVFDVAVDEIDAVEQVCIVATQVLGDAFLGDDPVRIGKKIQQQRVLRTGEFDFFPTNGNGLLGRVDQDFAELDQALTVEGFTALQRPDTGVEFGEVERFGQVIIGPEVEAFNFIRQAVSGGNDDDAGLLVPVFQVPDDGEPGAIGRPMSTRMQSYSYTSALS